MDTLTSIILRVGEVYILRLPSLGTAGYVWTYNIIGNGELVDISTATAELSHGNEHPAVGDSKDELFMIQAVKAGSIQIHFSQQRRWELNRPAAHEYIVEVNINN